MVVPASLSMAHPLSFHRGQNLLVPMKSFRTDSFLLELPVENLVGFEPSPLPMRSFPAHQRTPYSWIFTSFLLNLTSSRSLSTETRDIGPRNFGLS